MQTQSTLHTVAIERTATLDLVREVDFERLAADATNGAITLEALQTAGDFVVVVTPNGRGSKQIRASVEDEAAGRAWLEGFEACAALKKSGGRKPMTPAQKAAAKKKRDAKK